MGIKAIRHLFTGATTSISNYDQNKTNLGSLIYQYTGVGNEDKFAGPAKIGMARPFDGPGFALGFTQIIRYDSNIDWVFLSEASAAAATRRIAYYTYNRNTSEFTYMGFITLTYPVATTHTIRGFRILRELYTSGTVGVSGTTVTGSGSLWSSDRMSVGCRIGFGSTDPTQISTWYEISAVNSNTQITLTSSAGTITAGTPYVIDDIMVITANTNATSTNGGLFVTKGVRVELFNIGGTSIPAATTIDNIRAVYWLADASTVTNIATGGAAYDDRISWTDQRVFCINVNAATTPSIYVYNVRAALTLASGKDVTTNIIKTGVQTVVGTVQQNNNGRYMSIGHGPGAGVKCLYFVTTTRVYRVIGSNITAGSTTFLSDFMAENPPGTVNTYAIGNALYAIEYIDTIDRLVITTSGTTRSYITYYQALGNPFLHIFLNDDKQLDQALADSGGVVHPTINSLPFVSWSEGGILYLCRISTVTATNQIYTLPIEAHQTYAFNKNQLLISPKFNVSDSNKLYNVFASHLSKLGTDTFSLPTEPFKMYYRTGGISDNSGSWTELDQSGNLSGVSATEIQFAIAFKIIATTCIPSRILGINLIYEDANTDSHYTPSVGNSSIVNRAFAYRQSSLWNSSIPTLRIRLTNASNGGLIIDDNSLSNTFGTFQYSINNGNSWLGWTSSISADVVGNYIRYVATSLPDGVRVKALLTQL